MKQRLQLRQWIRKNGFTVIVGIWAVIFLVIVFLADWNQINSYTAYNTASLRYVKARVVSIESQILEKDDTDGSRYLGTQSLQVQILEGEFQGEIVHVENYLTRTQNVYVQEGSRIIVCVDHPQGVDAIFTVFNYYRAPVLWLVAAVFGGLVILVGRGKGVRALLGLLFTVGAVLFFMVQSIYHGCSPLLATGITVVLTSIVSLVLLNGLGRKTGAAIAGTLLGVGISGLLFALISSLLHISGYNTDAAESLLLISRNTGLSIRELLFAATLISALGAVMDVAMSIATGIYEVFMANQELSGKELFQAGIRMGQDMIGTMSNTLILAYAGTAMTTILVLLSFGYQTEQLLNSDYLSVEFAGSICSTMGVILTVPIASGISALLYQGGVFPKPALSAENESITVHTTVSRHQV